EAERQIALNVQVRKQPAVLEDVAGSPPMRRDVHAGCLPGIAFESHAAGRARLEPTDDPQQRRLSRAARSEQGGDAGEIERLPDGEIEAAAAQRDVERELSQRRTRRRAAYDG